MDWFAEYDKHSSDGWVNNYMRKEIDAWGIPVEYVRKLTKIGCDFAITNMDSFTFKGTTFTYYLN